MPGLVPGIHVFDIFSKIKAWMAGHRRAEATPSFGRLCPALTEEDVTELPQTRHRNCNIMLHYLFTSID